MTSARPRAALDPKYKIVPPFEVVAWGVGPYYNEGIDTLERAVFEFVRYAHPVVLMHGAGAYIADDNGIMVLAYNVDLSLEDPTYWAGLEKAAKLFADSEFVSPLEAELVMGAVMA